MKILVFGDIFAKYGRRLIVDELSTIKAEYNADFVIANGENSANGKGITKKVFDELRQAGIDVITSGNHIWDNKDVYNFIQQEDRLIRPANYPDPAPGRGYEIYRVGKVRVGVMNLSGTTYLNPLDNPFNTAEKVYDEIKNMCDIIMLDFHAEATSEKIAMGYMLDGKVGGVYGTHTHVQTADNMVLENGTGYITDVGMCGSVDGVIGLEKDFIIKKFKAQRPTGKYGLAVGRRQINGAVFTFDDETCKCKSVERIYKLY